MNSQYIGEQIIPINLWPLYLQFVSWHPHVRTGGFCVLVHVYLIPVILHCHVNNTLIHDGICWCDVLGSTGKRAKVGRVYCKSFHSENCQERYWFTNCKLIILFLNHLIFGFRCQKNLSLFLALGLVMLNHIAVMCDSWKQIFGTNQLLVAIVSLLDLAHSRVLVWYY